MIGGTEANAWYDDDRAVAVFERTLERRPWSAAVRCRAPAKDETGEDPKTHVATLASDIRRVRVREWRCLMLACRWMRTVSHSMSRSLNSRRRTARDVEPPRAAISASPTSSSADPGDGLSTEFVRERAARRLRVLGHPVRLRIVEVLARGPANVGDVAEAAGVSITVASRHLREMHGAELVVRSQSGNFVLYALADRDLARLAAMAYRGEVAQVRRVLALDRAAQDQAAPTTRKRSDAND